MFTAGDEVRRTQRGNNNAYCQDNEISWFDWSLVDRNRELLRFWTGMIAFRKRHSALRSRSFFRGEVNDHGVPDVSWHGCLLNQPGWGDPGARVLAFTLGGFNGAPDLHVMLNMHWEALDFEVPAIVGRQWFTAVDTSKPSPEDILDPGLEPRFSGLTCRVEGRSVAVLLAR